MDLPAPSTLLPLLLPALLAPSPLPPSLLSHQLATAHKFLSPLPCTAGHYQLPPLSPSLELKRLRWTEGGDLALELVGPTLFRVDQGGEVRAWIGLGDEGLGVELVWSQESRGLERAGSSSSEEEGEEGGGWKFQTISELPLTPPSALGNPNSTFHPSLEAALLYTHSLASPNISSLPIPITNHSILPPGTALVDIDSREGTTPGAYGDANSFWSGWTSDPEDLPIGAQKLRPKQEESEEEEEEEDEDEYNPSGFCINSVNAARQSTRPPFPSSSTILPSSPNTRLINSDSSSRMMLDQDETYWNSYHQSGIGSGDIGESEDRDSAVSLEVMETGDLVGIGGGGGGGSTTRSRRSSTLRAPPPTLSSLPLDPLPPCTISTTNKEMNETGTAGEEEMKNLLSGIWRLQRAQKGGGMSSTRFIALAEQVSR